MSVDGGSIGADIHGVSTGAYMWSTTGRGELVVSC
jgi:hypothetical protein